LTHSKQEAATHSALWPCASVLRSPSPLPPKTPPSCQQPTSFQTPQAAPLVATAPRQPPLRSSTRPSRPRP
jgi:hypothetical protein